MQSPLFATVLHCPDLIRYACYLQAKAKAELELLMMSDEAIRLGETGPEAGARAPALAKEARKKRKQNAKKLSKLKAAKASGARVKINVQD